MPEKQDVLSDEDRLNKMLSNIFKNSNAEEAPADEEEELTMNMLNQEVQEPEETLVVTNETPKDEIKKGVVFEEEDEEEIFLLHEDGQITSEITEVDMQETDIDKENITMSLDNDYSNWSDSIKEFVPEQSLIERAIYNKAISLIFNKIDEHMELSVMAFEEHKHTVFQSVLSESHEKQIETLQKLKKELYSTNFNRHSTLPFQNIDLSEIEDENLRKEVDEAIELVIGQIIGGITI